VQCAGHIIFDADSPLEKSKMELFFVVLIFFTLLHNGLAGSCIDFTDCNGHGTCNSATSTCVCDDGWGSASDIALFKAPDCSLSTSFL
jgi:hypothetical protein